MTGPDLAGWLVPAVMTILDDHLPSPSRISAGIGCCGGGQTSPPGRILRDWQAWEEHVAELIAAHVAAALADFPGELPMPEVRTARLWRGTGDER